MSRIVRIIATAGALVASMAAAQAQTPKRGGTLIVGVSNDPSGLNRNITSNNVDGFIACAIYQGLVQSDANYAIQPMLAKSWTISEDGRTYTFELNKANWQDGKPFTSDDVKFSLLEVSAKYSAIFLGAARAIEAIDTPAPDRVIIRLKTPYGPLLNSLPCSQGAGILPAHIFRGTDILKNPAVQKPVGLGPFLLKEWVRGSHVTLARNPDYYEKGKPWLDEVIYRIMPQPASRTQALLAGEIDYIPYLDLSISDYAAIRANPKLRLTTAVSWPAIELMFFNVTRKPLDDARVRQALMMATDREYLVATAFQGLGGVGVMPFSTKIPWAASPDIDYRKMYPLDTGQAEALLDAAGLKRGADGTRFSLNFMYATRYSEMPLVSQALKAMWAKVGVDLRIVPGETTAMLKRMFEDRDFDVTVASYSSQGDPALGYARAFTSDSIGKAFGNPSGYSNPELDRMFAAAEIAPNEAARGEIYRAIQAKLAADLPIITIHEPQLFNASAAALKGWEMEESKPMWRDAWLDR